MHALRRWLPCYHCPGRVKSSHSIASSTSAASIEPTATACCTRRLTKRSCRHCFTKHPGVRSCFFGDKFPKSNLRTAEPSVQARRFYFDDLHANLAIVPKGAMAQNSEVIQASRKCQAAIAEIYWNGEDVILEMKESKGNRSQEHAKIMHPEEDDVALVLHTSGTTGRPKAVL